MYFMKKKRLYQIIIVLVVLELLTIIGIQGYGIIQNSLDLPSADGIFSKNKGEKPNKPGILSKDKDSSLHSGTSETESSSVKEKPQFTTVEDSYFDDALFIGDSRTVALRAFSSFPNAYFFAKTGISTNSLFEYPASDEITGASLSHTLTERKYSKIYIMIGVNDLGYGTLNSFSDTYFDAIEKIKLFQPDAIIYVQSIVGVTKGKEASNPRSFNNQTVINRNAVLQSKCDGETVLYLDLFSVYRDENGYLDSKHSSDGLHISPSSLSLWVDYLKNNAIEISK